MTQFWFEILFWSIGAALAAAVALLLIRVVLIGNTASLSDEEHPDLQVYRQQLNEIARDLERGTLPADEAERLRVEVSRRLLAADAQARQSGSEAKAAQPKTLSRIAVLALAGIVVLGGLGTYRFLGAPGYGDLPRAIRIEAAALALTDRPSQQEAEAALPPRAPLEAEQELVDLVAQLRQAVAQNPDDLQGQVFLARYEAMLGNYRAAHQAQTRVIELKGENATARDFADLVDVLVLAANGYVSPEAQAGVEKTLELDPNNGVGLYYQGLMLAQIGRPDLSFRQWSLLLTLSPEDAPWVAPIRGQIEELAYMAGVQDYQLPPLTEGAQRGPTAEDVEAAADLSASDREQMIRGMVNGLSDRLAEEGGTVQEWAQLINALAVLGEVDRALLILAEARQTFGADEEAAALIEQTARDAGLTQ